MRYMPLIMQDTPFVTCIGTNRTGFMHWHSEMELLICLKGYICVQLEDRQYTLHPGDTLLLPGYVGHTATSDCPDAVRVAINFGYRLLKEGYPAVRDAFLFVPAAAADIPQEVRKPLDTLADIFHQQQHDTPGGKWRIQANLLLLCAWLQESVREPIPMADLHSRIHRMNVFYEVLQYVEKHYAEKITLEEMASLSGYATTYFCRQFKATIGISFYRYLSCYRISVACMLLGESQHSLADIARLTGFSSQTLFCRAFREITGMTPKQFQALPETERVTTWMN